MQIETKETGIAIYLSQIDSRKGSHYIMIKLVKWSVNQGNIIVVKVYAFNLRAPNSTSKSKARNTLERQLKKSNKPQTNDKQINLLRKKSKGYGLTEMVV